MSDYYIQPTPFKTPVWHGGHKVRPVDFFRSLIHTYLDMNDYETACYWADKTASVSSGSQQDVYMLAKCMYLCKQYKRAAHYIRYHKCERTNLYFRCLTAKCLYMAKEYMKALDLLDLENRNVLPGERVRESKWEPHDPYKIIMAQIPLLRGKIYEAMMNRILATKNYKDALLHDIHCYEAFHLLTQHQMLSRTEEISLLHSLPFGKQTKGASDIDIDFTKFLYASTLKKYLPSTETETPKWQPSLKKNLDILTGDAERFFYNCDFHMAYRIASQIMTEDPYQTSCLPVYIACLVELKKNSELFKTAHRLTLVMGDTALAWYAVGSYYFLIGKHESARRHLNKAICIEPLFGPAWLLFGHSFAQENEHDQAMAAYFKATQLMKGSHLPMLHVGLECGLSNNPQLAMKFLDESRLLSARDPFVIHEMGVVKFHEKKYDDAYVCFHEAMTLVERGNNFTYLTKWEALYNNFGHVCRKMHRYEDAIKYHHRALVLCPVNATTYAALGLVLSISGKTDAAVEAFHKALSLRRDDAFSSAMLRCVMEKLVEESNEEETEMDTTPTKQISIADSEDDTEEGISVDKPEPMIVENVGGITPMNVSVGTTQTTLQNVSATSGRARKEKTWFEKKLSFYEEKEKLNMVKDKPAVVVVDETMVGRPSS